MRGLRGFVLAAITVTGILLAGSLSGCAALAQVLTPGGALAPITSAIGATPAPVQHYSDGSTTERGNIPKVVGQKAGMLSPDGRTRLVTFTVTRIVTDHKCVNAQPPAPSNGHYVEVDLDVITTADLGIEGSGDTVTFAPVNWFYYPPADTGLIAAGLGATGPQDDCQLSVPPLPDVIGRSQAVSGSVLLDVRAGSVYLAYAPGEACGCDDLAWEWPLSLP